MNDVEKPSHGANMSEEDMHECKVCGRKFASKQGLGTHLTRTHGRKRRVAQTPRVITGEHRVKAERIKTHPWPPPKRVIARNSDPEFQPQFNRPLDKDKLAKYENEQYLLDAIEDTEYQEAVRRFLPILAREIDRRNINSPLMSVLVALTIDVSY